MQKMHVVEIEKKIESKRKHFLSAVVEIARQQCVQDAV